MEVVHYKMVEQIDYKIPYNGVLSAINKSEEQSQATKLESHRNHTMLEDFSLFDTISMTFNWSNTNWKSVYLEVFIS